MVNIKKKEKMEYTTDKFFKEFWANAQDFGKKVGCIIPNRPSWGWYKFCAFNNANMLNEYINTFMILT